MASAGRTAARRRTRRAFAGAALAALCLATSVPAGAEPDARRAWVVQVHAGPADEPLPEVALPPDGADLRTYALPFARDGERWRRVRVGPFGSAQAARAALDALRPSFPDAWVAGASSADRRALAATAAAARHTPPASGAASSAAATRPQADPPQTTAPAAAPAQGAASWAVQLGAAPAAAPLPEVPEGVRARGVRVYVAPFERDGDRWHRVRLGFFGSLEEADAVRLAVREAFPQAIVVREGPRGRRLSELHALVPSAELAAPRRLVARSSADPGPRREARTALGGDGGTGGSERPPSTSSPESAGSADAVSAWMEEGRRALAAGDLPRAVGLFTQVLSLPEHSRTPDALEGLAVARERAGQTAHARAEYEAYLERFPDAEGAPRVRQRLDALLTARAEPEAPLRPARGARDGDLPVDVHGSVSASYLRDGRRASEAGRADTHASLWNDLFVVTRFATPRLDVRSEFSGTHRFDFDDDESTWRAYTAFASVEDRQGPLSGAFGRLPGSRAGVIGRLDGARVGLRVAPGWRLFARGGFAVDPFLSGGLDTDTPLLGVSLLREGLLPGLDAELFAVHQRSDGATDRSALGGELRWATEHGFAVAALDYDVHFQELNVATANGSVDLGARTALHAFLDWRRLPFLTARNALIGQPEDSLDELRDRFGRGEIEGLASDRAARWRSATVGLTHRLGERFQLAGDVGLSDLSGTPASGGVSKFEGTGTQLHALLQLTGTDLVQKGDVAMVGARWTGGDEIDVAWLFATWRWRIGRTHLGPMVDVVQRRPRAGDEVLTLRPGLRFDVPLGRLVLDAEGRYEWDDGERFPGAGEESGYSMWVTLRYDF